MIGHAWFITISHHPYPVLAVLRAAVCAEATASVSAIATVLASVFMFVACALVGAGVLDVWLPLASVVLGVILGDGLAYEVGRRYHADIGPRLQASGHNDNCVRSEQFVERHGVQSLASALVWTLVDLAPGMFVGPSDGVAEAISQRMAFAMIVLAIH